MYSRMMLIAYLVAMPIASLGWIWLLSKAAIAAINWMMG
jgi:hypothetical protein